MNDLHSLSARELARRIRERDVTSAQVVDAHISRIEAVNPKINAVVVPLFDRARAQAKEADARIEAATTAQARAKLPPFLGVPCTIKDSYGVAGYPQTGGLVSRARSVAQEDATLVRRMRDAGFVILGITNIPEGLMWFESYNRVYGRTKNPHSLAHISGGSSGGEGAIIGAGGSPVGIGSDVGGSIRLPAVFNGICGHKPSPGRLPMTGHWPHVPGPVERYNCGGPLARTVADLRDVVRALEGPDGSDPTMDLPPLGDPPRYEPGNIKVYKVEKIGPFPPSGPVHAALNRSATALAEQGYHVERWVPPHFGRALELWSAMMNEGAAFKDVLGDGTPISFWREIARWPFGRSPHIFPSLGLVAIEGVGELVAPREFEKRIKLGHEVRRMVIDKLGDDGVILAPVFPTAAPRHGWALLQAFVFAYTGLFNVLHSPSTVVPVGFNTRGLPLGVQVAGPTGADYRTLHVAEMIERAMSPWRPARVPGVDT